jgi:hypothetical protein
MVGFMLLFAATLYQPAAADSPKLEAGAGEARDQPGPNDGIVVTGRRDRRNRVICNLIKENSAESRLGRTEVCLTKAEWNQRRDEAVAFYENLPRRNPSKGPSSTAGAAEPGMSPQ